MHGVQMMQHEGRYSSSRSIGHILGFYGPDWSRNYSHEGSEYQVTFALRMICLARASDPGASLQGSHLVGSSCASNTDRASPSRKSPPKFFTRTAEDDCAEHRRVTHGFRLKLRKRCPIFFRKQAVNEKRTRRI